MSADLHNCGLRCRGIAVMLAAAIASAPVPCAAQGGSAAPGGSPSPSSGPDAVAQARQHFTRGVRLYEEDDFRTALIEFNRAYEIAPNWQVLYNIGQAYYQLRDYANSLRTFERYVSAGGTSIAHERRQQVDREMDELRGRVAHVTFTSNVAGADVVLDDVQLGRTPFGVPQLVGAGRHKLTASKLGWISTSRVVDIAGGDNLTIGLDLVQEPHESREAVVQTVKYRPNYAATFIVGGIGVAGVLVGSIFGAFALNDHTTLNSECNSSRQCPYGTQSEIDAFSRNGLVSTIGFGVGAAGIVVAVVLFATERAKEGKEVLASPLLGHALQAASPVTVRPWVGPGGAGLSGTF